MNRKYRRITWIGIVWTLVLGTLSHFFYEWSHENLLIGLFSPINETVWEHLKLLFFPAFIFFLMEQRILRNTIPELLGKNFLGLFAGLLAMPLLFYGYNCFTGKSVLWVDIGIFCICVLITFLLPYQWRKQRLSPFWEKMLVRLGLLLAVAFVVVSLLELLPVYTNH